MLQLISARENSPPGLPLGGGHAIRGGKPLPITPPPIEIHAGVLAPAARREIEKLVAFLDPVDQFIHSLVVVGSAAYGCRRPNSDIDLVVIATSRGHEKVCEVVFEKELEESLAGGKAECEWTVLSSGETERLFQQSSPFACAIRHGAVLRDDGYLMLLRCRRYPQRPAREYYRACLAEKILTPYYATLGVLHRRDRKGPAADPLNDAGLFPAEMLARLVIQMLYLTLPARGLVPLTKSDLAGYVQRAYGAKAAKTTDLIISLVSGNQPLTDVGHYQGLRRFAVQLFREILRLAGIDHEIKSLLADGARLFRRTYILIQNRAMKNCVV